MKEKAILLDGAQAEIREYVTEVQSAKFTMFCEKHKYRNDISLDQKFRLKSHGTHIEE